MRYCLDGPKIYQISHLKGCRDVKRIGVYVDHGTDSGLSVSFGGLAFFGAFHVHWPSMTSSRFTPEKQNCKDALRSALICVIYLKE